MAERYIIEKVEVVKITIGSIIKITAYGEIKLIKVDEDFATFEDSNGKPILLRPKMLEKSGFEIETNDISDGNVSESQDS
jgi:hypothetical protein